MPSSKTMKIRILIVDDEPLARERVKRFLADERDIEIIAECTDGCEAVEAIRELKPDLVLLDVQIPELDGFGVLEQIGTQDLPIIIFITAYDTHALKAFDFHALDYLLKPFNRERFRRAVERARIRLQTVNPGSTDNQIAALLERVTAHRKYLDRIMVKTSGRIFFVRVAEIKWISAEGNYLRLHVGNEAHLLRETMNNLSARLDPQKFIRIHRSTLVNLDTIKDLQPMFGGEYVVTLHGGTQLTLSRTYREQVFETLDNQT